MLVIEVAVVVAVDAIAVDAMIAAAFEVAFAVEFEVVDVAVVKNIIINLNRKFLFRNFLFDFHIILTIPLNYYSRVNIYLFRKVHSLLSLLLVF
jgi:hypothetical protein